MHAQLYQAVGPVTEPDRAFVVIIKVEKHVSTVSFAATAEEAIAKADAHVEREKAKAAKRPAPAKKAKAEPPAEVAPAATGRRRQHHTPPPATDTVEEAI